MPVTVTFEHDIYAKVRAEGVHVRLTVMAQTQGIGRERGTRTQSFYCECVDESTGIRTFGEWISADELERWPEQEAESETPDE